jgi:DedD protein
LSRYNLDSVFDEPSVLMDSALKQRMLGAAVLIVLAIIFVPMLLDGSPQTQTETVDLSIPAAPEREFDTQVVPLSPPSTTPAPVSEVVAADPNAVATVDVSAPDRPDALAGTPSAPANDTVVPEAADTVDQTTTPPPAAVPADPAPVATTPAATPEPAPSAAQGRYFVSFGSYTKTENAQKLVADLKRAGVEAYSERVDLNGQSGLRVRAGPFVDRTQAEKARLLAKRARGDVAGTLVEVDQSAAQSTPAAGQASGWAVQIGAYQSEADANAQRDKLRAASFAAFVEPVRTEGGTLYRVRVGPEAQRTNAERLREGIRARFGLDGRVVAHP